MWGKIVSSVSNALDFNQATLSGCIDIIVTPLDDSTLRSTPFHVRFGKAKLLRSREKIVTVSVNGSLTDLRMKLGAAGEAYFVEETEESINPALEVSPFSSPVLSPRGKDEEPIKALPATTLDGGTCSTDEGWSWKWGDLPQQFPEDTAVAEDDASLVSPPSAPEPTSSASALLSDACLLDSSNYVSRVKLSLCGHLLYGIEDETVHDEEVFAANIVTWTQMDQAPTLWYHPSLVVRFDNKPPYYPAKAGLPLLGSWVLFNRPLSLSALNTLMNTQVTATEQPRSWMSVLWGSSADLATGETSPSTPSASVTVPLIAPSATADLATEDDLQKTKVKKFKKSLRPTSDQLRSLALVAGANRITFSVTSSLQGTKSVSSTVYLWPSTAKIVISDVDGTITRSDVLGQLMPIVGRDWSHSGVAELFTKVRQNGYYIMYLTARAIGQADSTRDYLFGLTQNSKEKLPDGPLVLSPDRLFPSFKREVIDRKPYLFKIAALRDIRNLFPKTYNPFYAGFGNRDSDHKAYVHIGVPEGKVFIIDTKGVIHHANTTYARTYETMSEICEHMFPPLRGRSTYEDDEQVRRMKMLTTMNDSQEEEDEVRLSGFCGMQCGQVAPTVA